MRAKTASSPAPRRHGAGLGGVGPERMKDEATEYEAHRRAAAPATAQQHGHEQDHRVGQRRRMQAHCAQRDPAVDGIETSVTKGRGFGCQGCDADARGALPAPTRDGCPEERDADERDDSDDGVVHEQQWRGLMRAKLNSALRRNAQVGGLKPLWSPS
jgi:hypothetical protein